MPSGTATDDAAGRPGIQVGRFPGATYPDKFANLHRELAPFPRPWTARYICALVVQGPGSRVQRPVQSPVFECQGEVEGEIWPEPRGTHGFGYDPIFYFPEYGATFGDVDDARKSLVAHRGRAFRQLKEFLG